MDFRLNEEQQQFADSLARWMSDNYGFEARKAIIGSPEGISQDAWQTLAELGATALPVPSDAGGLDGTAVDMMIVMQQLGKGLVVEPYFATALAVELIKRSGGHPILEQVAQGQVKLACALQESRARHDVFDVQANAEPSGDGYVLNGSKAAVIHGGQADALVVLARTAGAQRDTDGLSLFLVRKDAAGLSLKDYRTFDGQRAADVVLDKVTVSSADVLGQAGTAWDTVDAAIDHGTALLCAEALGLMEVTNAATLDYLKTRQQFGVPIGTFQVLQHRMADMYMHFEQARSITLLAIDSLDHADAGDRRYRVSAAKVRVGQAMKFIGQQSIQLHGGMGMTNEMPVSHYFKRMTAIELTLGDTNYHLSRFVSQPAFLPSDASVPVEA
jgi:alkylation response protein AidB-like acyl-CoA dehydrogenase